MPTSHPTFEIGEISYYALELEWVRRHVKAYNRNGRWGTCGACPGTFSDIEPEKCRFTKGHDHQLDAASLIQAALLRGIQLVEAPRIEKALTYVSGDV